VSIFILPVPYPRISPLKVILCVMTWAIWRQSKFIGIGLVLMTMTYLALQCVMANKAALSFSCEFLELMLFTPLNAPSCAVARAPYPGFRGCFITRAVDLSLANFAAAAVVETSQCRSMSIRFHKSLRPIVVLILLAVSAFRFCQSVFRFFAPFNSLFFFTTCRPTRQQRQTCICHP
jgi:hypothetical protein